MARNTDPSSRKHRRSPPDDEVEKSSKRHKHRHHRHHRSHRSKKHGEESNHAVDATARSSPPMNPIAATANNRLDDDVEEGEILEEEVSGGVVVKAIELREEKVGSQNLGEHADYIDNGLTYSFNSSKFESKLNLPKGPMVEIQDELFPREELEVHTNGDLDYEYHKAGKKHHAESVFCNGSDKRKSYRHVDTPEGDESKLGDWGKLSSPECGWDKNNTETGSASHDMSHDDVIARSRSLSHDFTGERSHSHSIIEEEVLLKRGRHNGKVETFIDDERMSRRDRDLLHSSKALEREHRTSYSRSLGGGDRHRSRDACGREVSREKDNWEWRKNQERERSWDRDQRREKDGKRSRDRDLRREMEQENRDWDGRREKERERSRDRDVRREKEKERSRDRDVRREKERERSRDKDVRREKEIERRTDQDMRREMERERIRDREMDRDRKREKQRGRSLERDRKRDMEEDLDKKRQKEGDKNTVKDVARSSDIHRDWEKEREKDSERYRERDRIKDQYRKSERERERRSDRNNNKARDIKSDLQKVYNSHGDPLGDRDKLNRDQDEQDDFEERISIQLAEQEDDLDRVKEESRKRSQAILEKHRNKQLQQQNESQSDDVEKDVEPAQSPIQSLLASNVAPETLDTRIDIDIYVAEPSFSVGKLPPQNGAEASERCSVVVGLGEGTPKSERSEERYCDDIFGETPAGIRKLDKGDGLPIIQNGLHDNWDDSDGYYG